MLNDVIIANKTYTKLNISSSEQLDAIAVKVIKRDAPDFLLPIKVLNVDDTVEVRYELGNRTRLAYLPDAMTKQEFVVLLENLLRPFKICNDWFLDYHNFYLNKSYITVGKTYADVQYVYVPDLNYRNEDNEILDFFRNLILQINLSDEPLYVMNLFRRLNERDASLLSILEYIAANEAEKTAPAAAPTPIPVPIPEPAPIPTPIPVVVPKPAETPKPAPTPAPAINTPSKQGADFGNNDMRGGLIDNLFGDAPEEEAPKKSGGFFGTKKEKKQIKEETKGTKNNGLFGGILGGKKTAETTVPKVTVPKETVPQTPAPTVIPQAAVPVATVVYQDDTETAIAGDDEPVSNGNVLMLELEADGGYSFPKLIEVDLSKGYATIGRLDKTGKPQADYNFEASLSFISRRHLRVEKQGEQNVIIDLAADKNGTMLNGEVMVANMSYPIKNGDRIMFSKKHRITYRVC